MMCCSEIRDYNNNMNKSISEAYSVILKAFMNTGPHMVFCWQIYSRAHAVF